MAGILSRVGRLRHDLLDFFYPPACLLCNYPPESGPLCSDCLRGLVELPSPVCARCRFYVVGAAAECPLGHHGIVHPVWALGLFDPWYRALIHAFKFRGRMDCGVLLGRRLAGRIAADPRAARIDVVVAVPLHPTRRRERGFNQSEILARHIAGRIERPLLTGALSRVRHTRSQTELDLAQRRDNVETAFQCRRLEHGHEVVLLVDDVLTTGSTLGACAQELRQAGAKQVMGAVAALADTQMT